MEPGECHDGHRADSGLVQPVGQHDDDAQLIRVGGQGKCGLVFVGLTPLLVESLELLEVITWRFGEEM